ncbi:tetratricopeptide repeat protein [Actinokineospora soli]|uniref:Tetratricopeptide repeat protein n=1 Tax=Actinokineospora soli TaxID=1048753 RepID=A0ABW2TX08_9PSEU
MAESAAARPAISLADLAAALRDRDRRSRLLRTGDAPSSVYTVFSWSLDRLPPAAAKGFRLLGCYPGRTFDEFLLAALSGTDTRSSADVAEALSRAHLVERTEERFRMHDLLREYASDIARTDLTGAERDEALDRVQAYHRAAVSAAVDVIAPFERHYRPSPSRSTTPVPAFRTPADAHRWLEGERQNVIATAELGPDPHTIHIARAIWRHLNAGGYNDEGARLCDLAVAAARRAGDHVAELHTLADKAIALVHLGRATGLEGELLQAIEAAKRVGDKVAEGRVLNSAAIVHDNQGDLAKSVTHDLAALRLAREAGDRYGEYRTLINLGTSYHRIGEVVKGDELSKQGLALALEDGNAGAASRALNNLGYHATLDGDPDAAIGYLRRALELTGRAGDRATRGFALVNLGTAHILGGDPHRASTALRDARDVAIATGDRRLLLSCYVGLGELAALTGQPELAIDQYRRALDLARESGYSYQAHRVHTVLVRAYSDAGDEERAENHRREAERLARELGLPQG